MRWIRPSGGTVELSEKAAKTLDAEMPGALAGPERGGSLIGRRIANSPDVVVDLVLGPLDADASSPVSFVRSGAHQSLVDSEWEASAGTSNYLGDWHTHPEAVPSPSRRDLATWVRLVRAQTAEHQPLFFVIVGGLEQRCWEANLGSCTLLRPDG